ncbi:MAG: hypothetical protein AAGJ81_16075 [Verrucomicrobiota bacterium]
MKATIFDFKDYAPKTVEGSKISARIGLSVRPEKGLPTEVSDRLDEYAVFEGFVDQGVTLETSERDPPVVAMENAHDQRIAFGEGER